MATFALKLGMGISGLFLLSVYYFGRPAEQNALHLLFMKMWSAADDLQTQGRSAVAAWLTLAARATTAVIRVVVGEDLRTARAAWVVGGLSLAWMSLLTGLFFLHVPDSQSIAVFLIRGAAVSLFASQLPNLHPRLRIATYCWVSLPFIVTAIFFWSRWEDWELVQLAVFGSIGVLTILAIVFGLLTLAILRRVLTWVANTQQSAARILSVMSLLSLLCYGLMIGPIFVSTKYLTPAAQDIAGMPQESVSLTVDDAAFEAHEAARRERDKTIDALAVAKWEICNEEKPICPRHEANKPVEPFETSMAKLMLVFATIIVPVLLTGANLFLAACLGVFVVVLLFPLLFRCLVQPLLWLLERFWHPLASDGFGGSRKIVLVVALAFVALAWPDYAGVIARFAK